MRCLYNGASRPNKKILELAKKEVLVPICPEQLGGLSTPREPSHISGDKVITRSTKDVTANFQKGAEETLKIVLALGISEAIMKQGSPSCGCGMCGPGVKGDGTTVKLLKQHGVKVKSQGQI